MTDLAVLQSRVAALAKRVTGDAQTNRAKAPEFAAFVDEFREAFGAASVRVRYVRWPDGSEQGTPIEPKRAPEPAARKRDPATSKAAATAAKAFASEHHLRILEALATPGTCYEIADLTGLDHVAVARRMRELCVVGRVCDAGITRPAFNGRQCTVWRRV